jgi:Fe-S-cluster-containing dehydrogenase component
MGRYSVLVDFDLCYGCQACQIACKAEFNLSAGTNRIRVVDVTREVGGKLRKDFIPVRCMHCTKPACLDACPEQAISQRADGIVMIDGTRCTGCKLCIEACPVGAPQINPETNVVEKCSLCAHRIDKGLAPACTLVCPTKAIQFGETNQVIEAKRARYARSLV